MLIARGKKRRLWRSDTCICGVNSAQQMQSLALVSTRSTVPVTLLSEIMRPPHDGAIHLNQKHVLFFVFCSVSNDTSKLACTQRAHDNRASEVPRGDALCIFRNPDVRVFQTCAPMANIDGVKDGHQLGNETLIDVRDFRHFQEGSEVLEMQFPQTHTKVFFIK